jgi:alpha-mannosidase
MTSKELEIENNLIEVSTSKLENAYLKVEFNRAGDIIRILDKIANREVMPPNGIANQLQAFEDRPLSWDAWDIDIFYDEKMWLAEAAHQVKVIENGPIRGTLEIHRRILNSDYIQRVSLANNTTRLDFVTTINWNERRVLLKVAFPVNILSPAATYEIQWGNVERPTHRNTSWDWARFETAAQKWVDLSEGNYGVSLLNDCKYGHDIYKNVIRLSLLRSTTAPDPTSDLGEHHFTYSLLPHQGNWKNGTISAAYAINDPLIVVDGDHQDSNPDSLSLVSCDANNVVIETIKLAEDGNGMIVRLYECKRERRTVSIKTLFPISSACTTNLLEENQETLDFSGKQLNFNIKPYQIITIRIVLENN